mgnify:CR=1 FL=1
MNLCDAYLLSWPTIASFASCVAETAGQSGRARSASVEVAMGVDRNAVGRARARLGAREKT